MTQSRKIAGAPISWGVCEVPGWGHQLDRDRVLAEMAGLGLTATELGPPGYLPPSPSRRAKLLGEYGLRAVGGFTPLLLHDKDHDPLPEARATLNGFRDGDVEVMVVAAATGADGYDMRPELDASGWKTMFANLRAVTRAAGESGRLVVLHPHVGTMIENAEDVDRLLDGSDIPLCLDTGHLLVGGTDPAALATRAAGRVAHVHLKDVDAEVADLVRRGNLSYGEAVRAKLYRPLGRGDVDVAAIVAALSVAGYDGWYVLEQDVVLDGEPEPGTGPVDDVRASLAYLGTLP
ncbi:inosose dehydratase [Microtetraspora sp. NBRC 13810]|uniref:TIM barrel protein n=1 Tax=Microtetraspora sp. NBRC 13810 TaxID=3030990 RepID=UPI0024A47A77|nr:TIM barrel protein [Microtetraspora sp. NBRC 13810]GLW07392.1 inosose dehydratase [Microtetraspora sp. NBRC 13810]